MIEHDRKLEDYEEADQESYRNTLNHYGKP